MYEVLEDIKYVHRVVPLDFGRKVRHATPRGRLARTTLWTCSFVPPVEVRWLPIIRTVISFPLPYTTASHAALPLMHPVWMATTIRGARGSRGFGCMPLVEAVHTRVARRPLRKGEAALFALVPEFSQVPVSSEEGGVALSFAASATVYSVGGKADRSSSTLAAGRNLRRCRCSFAGGCDPRGWRHASGSRSWSRRTIDGITACFPQGHSITIRCLRKIHLPMFTSSARLEIFFVITHVAPTHIIGEHEKNIRRWRCGHSDNPKWEACRQLHE